MKLGWSKWILVAAATSTAGCMFGNSGTMPVGRSSTTGGVICPSGYEPSRNGECVLTPNPAANQDAFR
jgi:hypothetical protein